MSSGGGGGGGGGILDSRMCGINSAKKLFSYEDLTLVGLNDIASLVS